MDDEQQERDLAEEARSGGDDGPGTLARAGQGASRIVLIAAGAVMAVFALANTQAVAFNWLLGETVPRTSEDGVVLGGGVPLIVLLLAAFALGAVIGRALGWRARRRRTR